MLFKVKLACQESAFPVQQSTADATEGHVTRSGLGRIPSIVITSESSPFLPIGRKGSKVAHHSSTRAGSG